MSKVTVAFGSFVAGVTSALLFVMLLGSQTSTFAQGVVMGGAEPVVPPLRGVFTNLNVDKSDQPLDGLNCKGCKFKDVMFTYGGGATSLVDPEFSGTIRLTLKGAAANTVSVVAFLQAMTNNTHPPNTTHNEPIIRAATPKETFTADLVTPFGQR